MVVSDGFEDAALLVSAASRTLRRQLRALAWVTLEEVALDAVAEGGRLVARTSARQVAERLGVDPGTAAGALRVLRDRGLWLLEREHGTWPAASACPSTSSARWPGSRSSHRVRLSQAPGPPSLGIRGRGRATFSCLSAAPRPGGV